MKTDTRKSAQSAEIAKHVAEYEAKHGKVQTSPLRDLSHDGRTVVKGRVQMTLVDRGKSA